MNHQIRRTNNIALALRFARTAQGLSQEDFDLKSSRTYVSSLERGLKNPTLNKVDELSEVLNMHPLSLLTLAYVDRNDPQGLANLVAFVDAEITKICAK